ncbi:Na(+)-translocating NADH-quinone reductase subunit F [Aureitalea sp. L0-47]|uniref:Na(+)-translocating NADH-quinone reductase subunit F n=1 Tax=Aureitalea sp. L0-47 TaxID=2816962 RepID=UPI0022378D40|nr:Na(+)-translocating NADH-quinone reductase subunit F [Aureitalea sp. L0-47]MCW5519013.1 Na(+)-translocating NADH-quinone reductase subunit F [Aureitalea sp. L0-47]
MITTQRFEHAIQKLYSAFHNDHLHPECAMQCAVGNICDNKDAWKHLSDHHGSLKLNYVGRVHERIGRKFSGYSPSELLKIEAAFLSGCGYELPLHHSKLKPESPTNKDRLFNGLCSAVEVLCELDQMKNVMDTSELFDYNKRPISAPETVS